MAVFSHWPALCRISQGSSFDSVTVQLLEAIDRMVEDDYEDFRRDYQTRRKQVYRGLTREGLR